MPFPVATNHLTDLGAGLSRPQVYECSDQVERAVKIRGLASRDALASEWIGAMLAVELEILTPAPQIVDVPKTAIEQLPEDLRMKAVPGLAFGNTYIRSAMTVHGVDSLLRCPNHAALLSALMVLDVWIETADRMRPDFGRNLLIDVEDAPRLMAIDFGMAFAPALYTLLGDPQPDQFAITLPPEVKLLVDPSLARVALGAVETLTEAAIVTLVSTTPHEWLDDSRRGGVIAYLLRRRGALRNEIESQMGAATWLT